MKTPQYPVTLCSTHDGGNQMFSKDVVLPIPPCIGMTLKLYLSDNSEDAWDAEVVDVHWDEKSNIVEVLLKETVGQTGLVEAIEADPSWRNT